MVNIDSVKINTSLIMMISGAQVHCVEVQENTELSTDNVSSPGNLLLRNL